MLLLEKIDISGGCGQAQWWIGERSRKGLILLDPMHLTTKLFEIWLVLTSSTTRSGT
jgi:hypothetical protein